MAYCLQVLRRVVHVVHFKHSDNLNFFRIGVVNDYANIAIINAEMLLMTKINRKIEQPNRTHWLEMIWNRMFYIIDDEQKSSPVQPSSPVVFNDGFWWRDAFPPIHFFITLNALIKMMIPSLNNGNLPFVLGNFYRDVEWSPAITTIKEWLWLSFTWFYFVINQLTLQLVRCKMECTKMKIMN